MPNVGQVVMAMGRERKRVPKEELLKRAREADLESGYTKGKELFYDDPDMQMMRERRMDLSKGYSGSELGAMREQARAGLSGERSNYLRQLAGRAARGGVGGARAAAMQGAADVGMQGKRAELERKMALDSAEMMRKGTSELQDFLMRQRFGLLSTGLGYAQLGVSDRTGAAMSRAAGQTQPQGVVGQFLSGLGF